jgi:hypothetical protein
MAKKQDSHPNAPVIGDDAGNLIKAGYKPTEQKLAEKHYNIQLAEYPEQYANTTFSDFLFESAAMAFFIETSVLKPQ